MSSAKKPSATLAKARAYCARQERCRSEMHAKLFAWGLQEDQADKVIARLIKHDFLNEGRFAEHYAVSKFRQKGWGRVKIRHALQQMEVGSSDITLGMNEIDADEYRATLMKLIKKQMAKERGRPSAVRQQRVIRYLISRGFEAGLVREALKG